MDKSTHVNIRKEAHHTDDILLQEIVEGHHMRLLSEPNVVSQILDNLRDEHQAAAHGCIFQRKLDIDYGW